MKKLVFTFPDDVSRHEFYAWFLDGGGQDGFDQSCEWHDISPMQFKPPGRAKQWDWLKDPDAEIFTIAATYYKRAK